MRVLLVHNRYQQRGGEDAVVDAEASLLRSRGIEVERLDADNDGIQGALAKIRTSLTQITGSSAMRQCVGHTLKAFRPDVVHVHNWFPTISAAIFGQLKAAGVPVVHTIHNYRLLCVGATLFRDGRVCEDCMRSKLRIPGIMHGCYRGSAAGSAAATAGMLAHWATGTWHRSVDKFIALTDFSRNKLVEGGLPAERISVKPNFVDPEPEPGPGDGGYFLYAGRLAEEKGLRVLLESWQNGPELPPLWIAGDGPLRADAQYAASTLDNVRWLGMKSGNEVLSLLKKARAAICPSLWYEGMPRVVIESLAVGTPVIASNIGGYPEMIVDGESGALFPTGDAGALLHRLRETNSSAWMEMRAGARQRFLAEYTGEKNFSLLLDIYRAAMRAAGSIIPIPASLEPVSEDASGAEERVA